MQDYSGRNEQGAVIDEIIWKLVIGYYLGFGIWLLEFELE
jgi:hypothetical protein